jgi:uncharacterized DUF497 family protein
MLDFDFIEWDDVNVDPIADNGLSMDEVEDVIRDPRSRQDKSRSSGRPFLHGETSTGRTIVVIYERRKDGRDVIIRPITAYEVED